MSNDPRQIPELTALRGLWTRSLIAWPDGRRDTTTSVRWLQGPAIYIDLRQPANRPDFSGVGALNALNDAQIEWLATQEGFAGRLTKDGPWFEWGREFDLQPQAMYSDCGRLWYHEDYVIEEGRDQPYIEHWHHHLRGEPSRCVALELREADGPRRAFLVRVGSMFMLARSRASALPDKPSLLDCVRTASDRDATLALLDCEIAFGEIEGNRWQIRHSSQPWREGQSLGPVLAAEKRLWTCSNLTVDGSVQHREWTIVAVEGDLQDAA